MQDKSDYVFKERINLHKNIENKEFDEHALKTREQVRKFVKSR